MNLTLATLALSLALLAGAVAEDYPNSSLVADVEPSDTHQAIAVRKVPRLDLSQARAIAIQAYPKATVTEAELDTEDGQLVYEIELDDGALERTLIVDAGNGRLLRESAEPRD